MMCSKDASVCLGGSMRNLGFELERTMAQVNPQIGRHLKITRYRGAYADAIQRVCAPHREMAAYLLAHTNAFYIRRDETPRKGPDKDKPYIVCEVCVDDAMAKSEINMRQELIKLALASEGIHFEEFRIITARGGMRSRHPFLEIAKQVRAGSYSRGAASSGLGAMGVAGDGAKRDKLHDLENVKRALILVFEDSSDLVIESIVAADVVAFKASDASQLQRTSRVAFRIHLYANDERIRALLMTHAPHILSHARELGLNARSLQVYEPEAAMAGHRAFPRCGSPEVYFGS